MSTIRLFYGRDTADMVRRIRDAAQRAEGSLGCPSTHPHVSRLEVRETVLEDEVIDAIVDLIHKQQHGLDTVNLDDCGAYMNKQSIQMAKALGQCRDVRLSEPTFLSNFFLESFLIHATRLTTLRIQDRLRKDQIEALAKGLTINTSLQHLDLSRSRLLQDTTSILADGLKHNTTLRSLRLRSLCLKDDDVDVLLAALKNHPTLEVLDLSFNSCRQMKSLSAFLQGNTTIRELHIGYQNMWQSGRLDVTQLVDALAINTSTIEYLSIPRCKITDDDMMVISNALRQNTTLKHLDVRENHLTDIGIESLAYSISDKDSQSKLRSLSIIKNTSITTVGWNALLHAVRTNWNVCYVDIAAGKYYQHHENNNPTIVQQQIQFYTALNRVGIRNVLADDDDHRTISLWPLILERLGKIDWDNNVDDGLDDNEFGSVGSIRSRSSSLSSNDDNDDSSNGSSMDLSSCDEKSGKNNKNQRDFDHRAFDVAYYLLRNGTATFR